MGNQMFQYAMALNIAKKLNTKVQVDLCSLLDRSKGDDFVYRNYDLDIFNLETEFVSSPKLLQILSKLKSASITRFFRTQTNKGRSYLKEEHFNFQPELIDKAVDNSIYEGWFQSYRYFEDIEPLIRKIFTFKQPIVPTSQKLLSEIKATNAICLNVRRTDFLKTDNLNTTNLDYFIKGAKYIAGKVTAPTFFIFSDDVEWCRQNIRLNHPMTIIDHSHKGEKFGNYMQLMIACKHFIIPNSSFAWWAVWLNQYDSKIVVAPEKWFNDPSIDTSDLIPPDWARL